MIWIDCVELSSLARISWGSQDTSYEFLLLVNENHANMTVSVENPKKKRQLPVVVAVIVAVVVAFSALIFVSSGSRSTTSGVVTSSIVENLHQRQDEQCSCTCSNVDQPTFASTLGLSGTVSDCCCSFADLERTNRETVHPLLRRIVELPFFAHFKIDLCTSCKLWDDAPMCVLRDCGVCECEKPPGWAEEVEWMPQKTGPDPDCEHIDDRVVTTVDAHISSGWESSPALTFLDQQLPFDDSAKGSDEHEVDGDAAVVVDLRLNPERYTGYAGPSAEKVWEAIHTDNCFQQKPSSVDEGNELVGYCSLSPDERIYNRIISGLHSSISLHIAHSYCLEMDQEQIAECKEWGMNSTAARERVLDHKDRLENLYAVFAILLRAVQKAGSAVATAVPKEDPLFSASLTEWTHSLLPQVSTMMQSCPLTFDETTLFLEGEDAGPKRIELQKRFKHLLEIMECVGCDRCRLWGTLQTIGIGTALKVLLDESSSQAVSLSRQEAVALVHTLERFSSALKYASEFQDIL